MFRTNSRAYHCWNHCWKHWGEGAFSHKHWGVYSPNIFENIGNRTNNWFFLKYEGNTNSDYIKMDWLIELCFTPFQQYFSHIRRQLTLLMSFLGFTSTRLGLWSVLPKDTPTQNPEDPVRLETRIPGLRVKHLTTEPRRTPGWMDGWMDGWAVNGLMGSWIDGWTD